VFYLPIAFVVGVLLQVRPDKEKVGDVPLFRTSRLWFEALVILISEKSRFEIILKR
jgi:hypothetical protein